MHACSMRHTVCIFMNSIPNKCKIYVQDLATRPLLAWNLILSLSVSLGARFMFTGSNSFTCQTGFKCYLISQVLR